MEVAVKESGTASSSSSSSSSSTSLLLGEYEWLAARVLSLTDPASACRSACVNRTFREASASDVVWSRMLPSHALTLIRHHQLMIDSDDEHDIDHHHHHHHHHHHQSPSSLAQRLLSLSSRQLFFRLCRSIPFSGDTQRYWLDPATGAECYMLGSKALDIVWGCTPQYWRWIPCKGSWFPTVAYLDKVCWFLVEGRWCQSVSPGSYVVSFRLKVGGARGGWAGSPVKLSLQNLSSGMQTESQCLFDSHHRDSFPTSSPPTFFSTNTNNNDNGNNGSNNNDTTHNSRNEANDFLAIGDNIIGESSPWVECDVGEFHVNDEDAEKPVEIKFSMREIEVLVWKSGIFLDGVLIRPTHVVNAARKGFVAPQDIDVSELEIFEHPIQLRGPSQRRLRRLWRRGRN